MGDVDLNTAVPQVNHSQGSQGADTNEAAAKETEAKKELNHGGTIPAEANKRLSSHENKNSKPADGDNTPLGEKIDGIREEKIPSGRPAWMVKGDLTKMMEGKATREPPSNENPNVDKLGEKVILKRTEDDWKKFHAKEAKSEEENDDIYSDLDELLLSKTPNEGPKAKYDEMDQLLRDMDAPVDAPVQSKRSEADWKDYTAQTKVKTTENKVKIEESKLEKLQSQPPDPNRDARQNIIVQNAKIKALEAKIEYAAKFPSKSPVSQEHLQTQLTQQLHVRDSLVHLRQNKSMDNCQQKLEKAKNSNNPIEISNAQNQIDELKQAQVIDNTHMAAEKALINQRNDNLSIKREFGKSEPNAQIKIAQLELEAAELEASNAKLKYENTESALSRELLNADIEEGREIVPSAGFTKDMNHLLDTLIADTHKKEYKATLAEIKYLETLPKSSENSSKLIELKELGKIQKERCEVDEMLNDDDQKASSPKKSVEPTAQATGNKLDDEITSLENRLKANVAKQEFSAKMLQKELKNPDSDEKSTNLAVIRKQMNSNASENELLTQKLKETKDKKISSEAQTVSTSTSPKAIPKPPTEQYQARMASKAAQNNLAIAKEKVAHAKEGRDNAAELSLSWEHGNLDAELLKAEHEVLEAEIEVLKKENPSDREAINQKQNEADNKKFSYLQTEKRQKNKEVQLLKAKLEESKSGTKMYQENASLDLINKSSELSQVNEEIQKSPSAYLSYIKEVNNSLDQEIKQMQRDAKTIPTSEKENFTNELIYKMGLLAQNKQEISELESQIQVSHQAPRETIPEPSAQQIQADTKPMQPEQPIPMKGPKNLPSIPERRSSIQSETEPPKEMETAQRSESKPLPDTQLKIAEKKLESAKQAEEKAKAAEEDAQGNLNKSLTQKGGEPIFRSILLLKQRRANVNLIEQKIKVKQAEIEVLKSSPNAQENSSKQKIKNNENTINNLKEEGEGYKDIISTQEKVLRNNLQVAENPEVIKQLNVALNISKPQPAIPERRSSIQSETEPTPQTQQNAPPVQAQRNTNKELPSIPKPTPKSLPAIPVRPIQTNLIADAPLEVKNSAAKTSVVDTAIPRDLPATETTDVEINIEPTEIQASEEVGASKNVGDKKSFDYFKREVTYQGVEIASTELTYLDQLNIMLEIKQLLVNPNSDEAIKCKAQLDELRGLMTPEQQNEFDQICEYLLNSGNIELIQQKSEGFVNSAQLSRDFKEKSQDLLDINEELKLNNSYTSTFNGLTAARNALKKLESAEKRDEGRINAAKVDIQDLEEKIKYLEKSKLTDEQVNQLKKEKDALLKELEPVSISIANAFVEFESDRSLINAMANQTVGMERLGEFMKKIPGSGEAWQNLMIKFAGVKDPDNPLYQMLGNQPKVNGVFIPVMQRMGKYPSFAENLEKLTKGAEKQGVNLGPSGASEYSNLKSKTTESKENFVNIARDFNQQRALIVDTEKAQYLSTLIQTNTDPTGRLTGEKEKTSFRQRLASVAGKPTKSQISDAQVLKYTRDGLNAGIKIQEERRASIMEELKKNTDPSKEVELKNELEDLKTKQEQFSQSLKKLNESDWAKKNKATIESLNEESTSKVQGALRKHSLPEKVKISNAS